MTTIAISSPIRSTATRSAIAATSTSDADGGLTLYIQSDSPGKDKESNWLPAPKDAGFKLALRLYAPKKEVADGTWAPPPVKRVS